MPFDDDDDDDDVIKLGRLFYVCAVSTGNMWCAKSICTSDRKIFVVCDFSMTCAYDLCLSSNSSTWVVQQNCALDQKVTSSTSDCFCQVTTLGKLFIHVSVTTQYNSVANIYICHLVAKCESSLLLPTGSPHTLCGDGTWYYVQDVFNETWCNIISV